MVGYLGYATEHNIYFCDFLFFIYYLRGGGGEWNPKIKSPGCDMESILSVKLFLVFGINNKITLLTC